MIQDDFGEKWVRSSRVLYLLYHKFVLKKDIISPNNTTNTKPTDTSYSDTTVIYTDTDNDF